MKKVVRQYIYHQNTDPFLWRTLSLMGLKVFKVTMAVSSNIRGSCTIATCNGVTVIMTFTVFIDCKTTTPKAKALYSEFIKNTIKDFEMIVTSEAIVDTTLTIKGIRPNGVSVIYLK